MSVVRSAMLRLPSCSRHWRGSDLVAKPRKSKPGIRIVFDGLVPQVDDMSRQSGGNRVRSHPPPREDHECACLRMNVEIGQHGFEIENAAEPDAEKILVLFVDGEI